MLPGARKGYDPFVGALLVPGAIVLYAGIAPPTDCAFCDGADMPRDRYARLFELIGTKFGEGDGESTFNLPNLPAPVEGVRYIIRLGTDMPALADRARELSSEKSED